MDVREMVVLGTLAVAMFNVGVIWLTQRVVYPVWTLVGEREWGAYHDAHKRRLPGTVFVPHGLGIVGSALMVGWPPDRIPVWLVCLALALPLTMAAATAVYWAPQQTRLSTQLDRLLLQRLLATHWIRVALISAHGAVMWWIAAATFA
ncbi:hypothetical protein AB0M80_35190 [Amycolatopsis sp. NPDC051045]|uniref:hypothetical protein n=1 Tax=Amycolatopsis sp. NPDC051045 TaxID=3156922 RepID=UPI003426E4C3